MVNPEIQTYYNKGMEFFGMNNFRNIPLPYSGPGKTFGDLIDQFFTECENKSQENNKGSSIKSDAKKKEIIELNNKNDGYYEEGNERGRKDQKSFELEIFWNRNKLQAWVKKLDRCKKHPNFQEISNNANLLTKEETTLMQWFQNFMIPEMLGKENTWYCSKCKDFVEAMKRIELYNAPPILFISLKRFKSGGGWYFKDKLEDKVNFPMENLDISDIILSNLNEDGSRKENLEYELYAVSNHYGNMGSGHYTAYAKNPLDRKWYEFNDSSVAEVENLSSIVSEAGYNLFYKKKDFKFDDNIDFDSIKNTWNYEDFKLEVEHYQAKEKEEDNKHSDDVDMEVN